MKEVKSIEDVLESLIFITNNRPGEKEYIIGTDEEDLEEENKFKALCIIKFNKIINFINNNLDNIEKNDLFIVKNALIIYHSYIKTLEAGDKYLELDSDEFIFDSVGEKCLMLQENTRKVYEQLVSSEKVKELNIPKKLLRIEEKENS